MLLKLQIISQHQPKSELIELYKELELINSLLKLTKFNQTQKDKLLVAKKEWPRLEEKTSDWPKS